MIRLASAMCLAAALGCGSGATFALIARVTDPARVGGVTFFLCREGLSTDGVQGAQLVRAAKMLAEIDQRRRSEMTALAHLRRQQVGLPSGRPRRRDPELDRMIHAMLEEGVPVDAVARRLGVGRGFVRLRAADRVTHQQGG